MGDNKKYSGVFLGKNISDNSKEDLYLDFYDLKNVSSNYNITLVGNNYDEMNYFISKLTLRSALCEVKTAIVDTNGAYERLVKANDGLYITPNIKFPINIFDVYIYANYSEVKDNIRDTISSIIQFIGVLADGLTGKEKSVISCILFNMYNELGFTNKEDDAIHEPITKKTMPTLSDFYVNLNKFISETNDLDMVRLSELLTDYINGGKYDMFDCYTSDECVNIESKYIIAINTSVYKDNTKLHLIGDFISLKYIYEKFAKSDNLHKKRIIYNKAMLKKDEGNINYRSFLLLLETISMRVRLYNCGLLFFDFTKDYINLQLEYKPIIMTEILIFFKNSIDNLSYIKNAFKLSEEDVNFLSTCNDKEIILKTYKNVYKVEIADFEFEDKWIGKI